MTNLRMALPEVELTLDPHAMEDAYSMLLILQVHRGLLRYTPEGDVIPDLAEEWTEFDHGRRYRFKLKNAFFSDGSKITASHVKYSIARIFKKGASIGADLETITGSKAFRQSGNLDDLGIKLVNDNEFDIYLDHPSSLIFKQLSAVDCAILKLSDLKEDEKFSISTSPGAGPYRVKLWNTKKIVLEKWRHDRLDSHNPPNTIEISVGSKNILQQSLNDKNDVLDWDILDPKDISKLKELGWKQYATDLSFEHFVILNPKKIHLNVRQYLFTKTDQNQLADAVRTPSIVPAHGLIPHGVSGSLNRADMDMIKSEIKANTPKGSLKLQYVETTQKSVYNFALWLKNAWETQGFKVILVPTNQKKLLKDMFSGHGEAIIGSKGLDYFDGFSVLSYFRSTYESNYFHVKNKKIDSSLDEATSILDPQLRRVKYIEIQKEIMREMTIIPLVFGSNSAGLWSHRIKYVPPHPGGLHTLPLESVEMQ